VYSSQLPHLLTAVIRGSDPIVAFSIMAHTGIQEYRGDMTNEELLQTRIHSHSSLTYSPPLILPE
jgi:hypothetical protein